MMHNPTSYLIDTHCWLWWHIEPNRLTNPVIELIENKDSVIFFSVVSAWEIVIKYNLKKIRLPLPPSDYVSKRIEISYMEVMTVHLTHTLQVEKLPDYHKDPFDRLLISQAMTENLAVITSDHQFKQYDVEIVEGC